MISHWFLESSWSISLRGFSQYMVNLNARKLLSKSTLYDLSGFRLRIFNGQSDLNQKILSRNPDKSYSVDFDNNFLAFKFTMYWEDSLRVWQYGLWSFQTGGTKLERFLPKNQHTQRKLLNFENWVNGKVSKSAKSPNLLTFKVDFLYQKLSESFSIFFHWRISI